MLPNRITAYEQAPLDELLAILLRQFKRPLASHGITITDAEAGAGGEIGDGEVEIDEQLIAGEGPAIRVAGNERGGASVHEGKLHVGVRGAIRCQRTAALRR